MPGATMANTRRGRRDEASSPEQRGLRADDGPRQRVAGPGHGFPGIRRTLGARHATDPAHGGQPVRPGCQDLARRARRGEKASRIRHAPGGFDDPGLLLASEGGCARRSRPSRSARGFLGRHGRRPSPRGQARGAARTSSRPPRLVGAGQRDARASPPQQKPRRSPEGLQEIIRQLVLRGRPLIFRAAGGPSPQLVRGIGRRLRYALK